MYLFLLHVPLPGAIIHA